MLNQTLVVGNLGADVEVRYMQNGDPVANLSVATSKRWTDKNGEEKKSTQWHKVVAYKHDAEDAKDYKKGDLVCAVGEIKTRKWTDNNGNDRYITEVHAKFLFVKKRGEPQQQTKPNNQNNQYDFAPSFEDDGIPF